MSVFQNIKNGIPAKQTAESQDKPGGETDLQKLRRVDLLELLLEQIRKNEIQTAELEEATDLGERLKAKLDDKDAQLERLKVKLDDKDAQLERLKAKLNQKDEQFERLKAKLDQKDAKIGLLEKRLHELAEKTGAMTLHDLELEEQAVERYLQQLLTQKDESASAGSHAKRSSISLPEIAEE